MAWKWICIPALGAAILFMGDLRAVTPAQAMIVGSLSTLSTQASMSYGQQVKKKKVQRKVKKRKTRVIIKATDDPPCKCWHWSGGKKTCHPCW